MARGWRVTELGPVLLLRRHGPHGVGLHCPPRSTSAGKSRAEFQFRGCRIRTVGAPLGGPQEALRWLGAVSGRWAAQTGASRHLPLD